MVRALALMVVALCGCFGPDYPVGLACTDRGECPGQQICVDAVCVLQSSIDAPDGSPGGGGGGEVDAGGDPTPDATPCTAVSADDDTCDGVDDDCDGSYDEDAGITGTWYVDRDGDGYGTDPISACAQPPGTADQDGDCWDSAAAPSAYHANPGQTAPQGGLMGSSTTEIGDWNCDGTAVYETVWCSPGCGDPRCSWVDYSGWDTTFAECGATESYCTSWDPYKDYCAVTEPKLQRCL